MKGRGDQGPEQADLRPEEDAARLHLFESLQDEIPRTTTMMATSRRVEPRFLRRTVDCATLIIAPRSSLQPEVPTLLGSISLAREIPADRVPLRPTARRSVLGQEW